MNPWLALGVAGLLEIVWALGLKADPDWRDPMIGAPTVAAMIGSFWFLSSALKHLPVGTAYAVWTGVGAVGVAILGVVLFKEPVTLARIGFIAVIVVGILGLRFTAG